VRRASLFSSVGGQRERTEPNPSAAPSHLAPANAAEPIGAYGGQKAKPFLERPLPPGSLSMGSAVPQSLAKPSRSSSPRVGLQCAAGANRPLGGVPAERGPKAADGNVYRKAIFPGLTGSGMVEVADRRVVCLVAVLHNADGETVVVHV
jgi:hypothetical protein